MVAEKGHPHQRLKAARQMQKNLHFTARILNADAGPARGEYWPATLPLGVSRSQTFLHRALID